MPVPQGDYRAATVHDGVAFSAGMTPRIDGKLTVRGLVGGDVTVDVARAAAGLAASNALTAVADVAGGLDRVERCLRMTVYIAGAPGFSEHSAVADGASAALRERLAERGVPARAAVGVASLPGGAPVEVELTVAVS